MESKKSFWLAVFSVLAVGLVHLAARYFSLTIDPGFLMGLRWYAIGALAYYGYQQRSLTTWILISMVVGMEVGVDFPQTAGQMEVLSKIFIQLIKTVIAPLLLATLVVGIAGQSNSKAVGRMSAKAFTYFIVATSIALVVGLVAINFSKAGVGITSKTPVSSAVEMPVDRLSAKVDSVKGTVQLLYGEKTLGAPTTVAKQDWKYVVLHIFPENIAKAVHEGAVLQIVVFSLIFGFALRQVSEVHRKVMLDWLESLGEVMFKFTNIIMYFAPFAVGGAMAYTIGTMGFEVVWNLVKLLGTLYAALLVFILLVFIPVLIFFKIPIRQFFKAIYEPASLAFATASSEAAFPKAMSAMEQFGVPRKIVSFVLPTGYSFNLDGSTLYLSLASIFCAQAAGITLSWETQLALMGTLLLTSKGVAGVPRASLVILAGTVNQFHIPEWPIAVILGIDALMDMGRTSVNLMGNCLASAVVARWEGEFDDEKAHSV
ncbi:MAG: cation:dicarboxylase symporter family transporter [Saprospiraceae bacterium]|nr:cation:dicarboxylase symporter family transporter [Saprospiraceae bacterium]